ncbi:hypothetical protein BDY21DRAFT_283400 [Lineolata rhizophorae]|uniref:UBC core domain-containing protein n=1 Tax=Lineolata rhizophorae TaxID=578093 RepID=A0A6A6P5I2_9PEZI|nr:hypothetical protein BDY21DRAFT_283400 [Lineolata rhizophorae]
MLGPVFCADDACALKADPSQLLVIDRSPAAVHTHEPSPQRDYQHSLRRDPSVSEHDYESLMRTGVPPRGTVVVSWIDPNKRDTAHIAESALILIDRPLVLGDIVKKDPQSPLSGAVMGFRQRCDLKPVWPLNSDRRVRDVPIEELESAHDFLYDDMVVYGNWVGAVTNSHDEVTVMLDNNTVVVPEKPQDLQPPSGGLSREREDVGNRIKTVKGNLRRGRWIFGAFNPNVEPVGTVVQSRVLGITVHWLATRPLLANAIPGAFPESVPPDYLDTDVLENVKLYIPQKKAGNRPADWWSDSLRTMQLPRSAYGVSLEMRMKFVNLDEACQKYPGLSRIPRASTMGFDMNVFSVQSTRTEVLVQWQDRTVTVERAMDLIPEQTVDDDHAVWPGEVVCTVEQASRNVASFAFGGDGPDAAYFEPSKVGVVQSVAGADRIARVRWFTKPTVRFYEDDLLPDSHLGELGDAVEEVSLYDIQTTRGLTVHMGDRVVLGESALKQHNFPIAGDDINWFGDVVALDLDGQVTVQLGLMEPVREVKCMPEQLTVIDEGGDMAGDFDGSDSEDGLDDELDEELDEAMIDIDDEVLEQWYEDEEGHRLEHNEESASEDWSTEDDNLDDGDVDESSNKGTPQSEADTPVTDIKDSSNASLHGEIKRPANTPKISKQEPTRDNSKDSQLELAVLAHADTSPSTILPSVSSNSHTASVPNANTDSTTTPEPRTLSFKDITDAPSPFAVLDSEPPSSHYYFSRPAGDASPTRMRRIAKEHKILRNALPDGVYVRSWETRMDLLRILIVGPLDTPYELAPFVVDMHMGASFPNSPPEAFFHSWTGGRGAVNPNLYEDGKICLSLLGTWHSDDKGEAWSPAKSTVLQILVSLLGLVLVREPYYNEAGYQVRIGAPDTRLPSALYSERTYFASRRFITHVLSQQVPGVNDIIRWLYVDRHEGCPRLVDWAVERANAILERSNGDGAVSEEKRDGLHRISRGAAIPLGRWVKEMENWIKGEAKGEGGQT